MMRGVMKSLRSDGLPSRPSLRTPALWFLAAALPARKLVAPTAPKIDAKLPISFLRLKIVDAMCHLLRYCVAEVELLLVAQSKRYGKAKLKISLPAAMATYCLSWMA